MIKVAVCDDCEEDLEAIGQYIQTYKNVKKMGTELKTYFYTSSLHLMDELQSNREFDLYILDMLMPESSGIELAGCIRKRNTAVPIIYITSTKDYALEAYGVHAIRYLIKPVDENDFISAMDFAIDIIRREETYYIKTKSQLIRTLVKDIIYIENVSRQLCFNLQDGTSVVSTSNRVSFEKRLSELIHHPSFVRPHKSYLVNMDYIYSISSNEMKLDNGKIISISRSNAGTTKSVYLKYLTSKERWEGAK